MALQVVKTSKKFSLTAPDWLKGLLMAIGAPVITLIIQSTNAGTLTFDWKALLTTAISAAGMYLLKNFFTPSQTTITGTPAPDSTTTVVIPPAAEVKAGIAKPTITETPKQ